MDGTSPGRIVRGCVRHPAAGSPKGCRLAASPLDDPPSATHMLLHSWKRANQL